MRPPRARTRRAASSRNRCDARTLPLGIGRREVLANVTVADRTEQCIRQRVQAHIRIRVPFSL